MIATTGGYIGDTPPYQGHVVVISAANGRLLHVWNSLCSDVGHLLVPSSCPASDSAIWGRAGAVVVPGSGDLLVATGNAPWNGRNDWGDSVLLLSPSAQLLGNYTPANTEQLNESDLDLGSTSPVLPVVDARRAGRQGRQDPAPLPRAAARHGAAQGARAADGLDPVGDRSLHRAGGLAARGPDLADRGGQRWHRRLAAARRPPAPAWRNGNGGTSPVVAGGLLWVYDPGGGGLRVYRPGSGSLVATLPAGSGHWNSPIAVDGRVALPEGDANDHATHGVLDIWRLG